MTDRVYYNGDPSFHFPLPKRVCAAKTIDLAAMFILDIPHPKWNSTKVVLSTANVWCISQDVFVVEDRKTKAVLTIYTDRVVEQLLDHLQQRGQ